MTVSGPRDRPSTPRESGRSRVVDVLRTEGAASRAELVRATGLSRATVSAVVTALQHEGLVVEEPAGTDRGPGRGRPPNVLRFNASARAVLGLAFDHGGVRVAVADQSLQVLAEEATRLQLRGTPLEATLAAAASLVDRVIAASGVQRDRLLGAGVSLPVPLDFAADRVVAPKIIPPWVDLRPRRAFEELTGLPVQLDNDANAAALAELRWGAGRGLDDFVYVKLSPGLGAAIVSGGRVYRGGAGFAGELGHIRVSEHGPVCPCGNRGCLGTSLSMASLIEQLRPSHGAGLTAAGVLELLSAGDAEANRVVHDAGRVLARALANLCNVLNPQAIIIGGALAAGGEALVGAVREALASYALGPIADTVEVVIAELGARADVLGALALVPLDAVRHAAS